MAVAQPLITDVEAVPVQGEKNKVGVAQVLMAQLPVESLSVQPGTCGAQSGRCRRLSTPLAAPLFSSLVEEEHGAVQY